MNKLTVGLTVLLVCASLLVGCSLNTAGGETTAAAAQTAPKSQGVHEAPAAAPDIAVTIGQVSAGMKIGDVAVTVTFNGEAAEHQVIWNWFEDGSIINFVEDNTFPENYYGCVDIYYTLPKGVALQDLPIEVTAPEGKLDFHNDGGTSEDGCQIVWTRVVYGKAPEESTTPVHTHSWVEDPAQGSPAACARSGYKTYNCACGESYQETIPAPGHDLLEGSALPATCTEPGNRSLICTVCNEVLLADIPALGHSWSEWAYSTGRVHARSCATCGETEEANHNIPSGTVKCTDCGADIIN